MVHFISICLILKSNSKVKGIVSISKSYTHPQIASFGILQSYRISSRTIHSLDNSLLIVGRHFGLAKNNSLFINKNDLQDSILFGNFYSSLPYHVLPVVEVVAFGCRQRRNFEDCNSFCFVAQNKFRRLHDYLKYITKNLWIIDCLIFYNKKIEYKRINQVPLLNNLPLNCKLQVRNYNLKIVSMKSEFAQIFMESDGEDQLDIFDSPMWPNQLHHQVSMQDKLDQEFSLLMHPIDNQREHPRNKVPKIQKSKKIRTSRNVQKTYHSILKHWLQKNKCSAILPKYNEYFNQRVYFILVLDQILKQVDGQQFSASYEKLAREVIAKKQTEISFLQHQKESSEQSKHLKRVVSQIDYSVKACKQFVNGNVLDSLVTVYKRDQTKISKIKQFEKAVQTFKDVTGHNPQNF